METATETPIRAYQIKRKADNCQYAILEWIIEGEDDLFMSIHDDSGDMTPYFMNEEIDLIVRRTDAGHLVCDVIEIDQDDISAEGERIAVVPFAIHSPEAWPDEWIV